MKKTILFLVFLTFVIILAEIICGALDLSRNNASCLLCRADSGEILYSQNANEHIAPASLTKLLTASVALNYISPDKVFTVGSERKLIPNGSSVCLILPGHRLKMYDLITGMLLASGNDAAYTVAVSTARELKPEAALSDIEAVEFFCGLMNEFAREIGMCDSHFTNPDGSDDLEQYTTALDMTTLAKYALSVPEIREIAGTYRKFVLFESGESITWTNSNKLLDPDSAFYSEYAVGMKTGTTDRAGSCLIAAFEKDGITYISVAAGLPTDLDRYKLTLKIFSEYART